ncbi:short-chain collagen C4-like isoform X2 [Saccostrea cucullata]|uniref:short-chain collagen C4-like isoform X2 n=1 Tax=Saccostrea cuccullata TaxID=36930 RepID=UPI002ECFC9FE
MIKSLLPGALNGDKMSVLLLYILWINLATFGWAGHDNKDKRLLLSDPQMMQVQLQEMQRRIQALEAQTSVRGSGNGAVYTIWGRASCPAVNGTATLYSGITGGGMYNQGSGVTTLCLPHNPDSLPADFPALTDDHPGPAYIFGAEYQLNYKNVAYDDDVPCAVCHAQTSTSALMIPAKLVCPQTWKLQYSGFLSAERSDYKGSDYICVDLNPEYLEGTRAVNADGRLIFPVQARCGSLPCPPYKEKQYVSCVVCAN